MTEPQRLSPPRFALERSHVDLGEVCFEILLHRAERLAGLAPRTILAVAGLPGAGKSTLAARLVSELGGRAALMPMDGFHLAQSELERLGRADRKGAPDTFDAGGYVSALRRLRRATEPVVYVPYFDRTAEEPIAGGVPLPCDLPLVITEGNYLLLDREPWAQVVGLVDEAWFCGVDESLRTSRLIERHMAFGKSRSEAEAWAYGSDQANAVQIALSRHRADLAFELDDSAADAIALPG